ncbi:MAG: CBS domain-containing protein [Planctomycetaceae bacterium]
MTTGRICVREIDIAAPTDSVQAVAQRMHSRKVGAIVVQDFARKPIGIVTDRDLAIRVVGQARDPGRTCVRDVMTRSPVTTREDTPLEESLRLMRRGSFRRLPVVDNAGCLVGLVTLDDILQLLSEEFVQIGQLLEDESPSSLATP